MNDAGNAESPDFTATDYDDTGFSRIAVPSTLETKGLLNLGGYRACQTP